MLIQIHRNWLSFIPLIYIIQIHYSLFLISCVFGIVFKNYGFISIVTNIMTIKISYYLLITFIR